MKSYLSLIPLSAKVHKRQNRMTHLCIIFAVFLVTAIFNIAEMGIRLEIGRLLNKHGSESFEDLFNNGMVQTLLIAAVLLFFMILIAGVLMISSSLNSNVAQRTKFFGMMRCIGMSKQQIIRFVRLEALNWCKTAIPIGVLLGVVMAWVMCAILRFFVGDEFSEIPIFGVSLIGIASGIIVGIVTVLISASAPAKRAAKVSPVTAVSGTVENKNIEKCTVKPRFCKIETALGIHHAVSAKKNLILMMGSFALSIILFLSFSVLIELIGHIMPQFSNTADISISSVDAKNSIDTSFIHELGNMNGVKNVYGRKSAFDVPAQGINKNTVDLISYDTFDLKCLVKDKLLQKGSDISKVYGDSGYVLAIADADYSLKIGSTIQVSNQRLEIAGILKYNPFTDDGSSDGKVTLITSGETFTRLTGETDYSLIMIQTTAKVTDEDVLAIRSILDENYNFQDKRDLRTTSLYLAFMLFVYGFLAIITLVTMLNIMNSISMSVSARIKQYGAMRAVGMDEFQLTKMIAAEAFTYAASGCLVGCAAGLWLSKWLYSSLITSHYSYAIWKIPVLSLTIIVLIVAVSAILAVYAPAKRIQNISITDTINEL